MGEPSGKTILVVDDDEVARKITVKQLEARPHQVVEADSGAQAIQAFQSGARIDLLLLDIVMPEQSGFETLARIGELGVKVPPVIMLSAETDDQKIMEGYEAGADYYLTKPCKLDTLLNIVDYLIGDLSAEERAKLETLI